MSIESLRLQTTDPDLYFATVDRAELEALCDLADGARRWINAAERMDINEVAHAEAAIRAALARLDGENTG